MTGIRIRPEDPQDLAAIEAVHLAAFGRADEGRLVDELRAGEYALVSLVAVLEGRVAGHILFSRMWIESPSGRVDAVALAPVAVLPEHQRKGIGGRLIESGLELVRDLGEVIVIVLGHPEYYPRFGFSSEKASMLESPFPPEAYMAMELRAGALEGIAGRVVYPAAFGI